MIGTGACDYETFAVNENAGTPYRSGIPTTTHRRRHEVKTGWVYQQDPSFKAVWNQGIERDIVLWDYDTETHSPYLWVIYANDDGIIHMWESENYPSKIVDVGTAPIIFDSPQDRAPGSGGHTRVLFPSLSDMETVEDEVQAASLPAWVTGTRFGAAENTTILLEQLYLSKQIERGLQGYKDLNTTSTKYLDAASYTEYYLLWLRSASQILWNHRGSTMIPLMKEDFKVNTTTLRLEKK